MKKFLYAAVCGAILFTSCSKDEDTIPVAEDTVNYIEFNAPSLVSRATRAAVTESNFTSQKAKVKVLRGTTLQAELELSYANKKWTPSIQTPWYANNVYDFYSAMPSTTGMSDDGKQLTGLVASADLASGTDVLFAATEGLSSDTGAKEGVNLAHQHVYNKINITFGKPDGVYTVNVKSAKLWLPNITNVTWQHGVGAQSGFTTTHTTKQTDAATIGNAYTSYNLTTGVAGSSATSADYIFLVPNTASLKAVYLYADIEYEIKSGSTVIESKSIAKAPVKFDAATYGAGNKAINLNFTLDSRPDVKYNVSFVNWSDASYEYNWNTGESDEQINGILWKTSDGSYLKYGYNSSYGDMTRVSLTSPMMYDEMDQTSRSYGYMCFEPSTSVLVSLDFRAFDSSYLTNMENMFRNCTKLTSLDIRNLNTKNVTNMNRMFENCSSLTSLNVQNFDTKNVTTMYCMFYKCSSLTSLDVRNFNVSKVTSMSSLFSNCTSLTYIDMSGWSFSSNTSLSSMFSNCPSLSKVKVASISSGWVDKLKAELTQGNKGTTWVKEGDYLVRK